jgi:Resolvase, N terminal domain
MVAAWSVDRLGRSLQDLVGFLAELQASRVDLFLHQQGLDTSTPAGKAMFQMIGVFAEFERAMIVERTKAVLIPPYATGELRKDRGLLRMKPGPTTHEKAPAKPGTKLDQIHLQCVIFATHTGGIMSWRLSTPPAICGGGGRSARCACFYCQGELP